MTDVIKNVAAFAQIWFICRFLWDHHCRSYFLKHAKPWEQDLLRAQGYSNVVNVNNLLIAICCFIVWVTL